MSGDKPELVLKFSHSLSSNEHIKWGDYIAIDPVVDVHIDKVSDHELRIPVVYGQAYDIILKSGIPSAYGEKTKTIEKISAIVNDQPPRISFNSGGNVLIKTDVLPLPLSAINVEKVDIDIIRIKERAVIARLIPYYYGGGQEISTWQLGDEYGQSIYKGQMDLGLKRNVSITKKIPLQDIIKDHEPGVYIIKVNNSPSGDRASAEQCVLISNLGISSFWGSNVLRLHVHDLKTAMPIPEATVTLYAKNHEILTTIQTNKKGIVSVDGALLRGKNYDRLSLVTVKTKDGEDFNFLRMEAPAFDFSSHGGEGRKPIKNQDLFLYMSRDVFRPGEMVEINGLLRTPKMLANPHIPLVFRINSPNGQKVFQRAVKGDGNGFYTINFQLLDSSLTGPWRVEAFIDPKEDPIAVQSFAVEDFSPARLTLALTPQDPIRLDRKGTLKIAGRFLFGSTAKGLHATGFFDLAASKNPFKEFKDFQFGLEDDPYQPFHFQIPKITLDDNGEAIADLIITEPVKSSKLLEAKVTVQLQEPDGRFATNTTTARVIGENDFFIGIKGPSTNNKEGNEHVIDFDADHVELQVITVDPNGKMKTTQELQYKIIGEDLSYKWFQANSYSSWKFEPVSQDNFLKDGSLSTKKDGPVKLDLDLKGYFYSYRIEITDPKTSITSSLRLHKGYQVDGKKITPDMIPIQLNKNAYDVGDVITAEFTSLFDGHGIICIANNDVLHTKVIEVKKGVNQAKIKVKDSFGVGAYVLVDILRPLKDNQDLRASLLPKRAVGIKWFTVGAKEKTLSLEVKIPPYVRPQENLAVQIKAQELGGKGKTFVQVMVVDEGIHSIAHFTAPNPVEYFLGKQSFGIRMRDLYNSIINPVEGEMGQLRSGGGAGGVGINHTLAAMLSFDTKRKIKIVSMEKKPVQLDKKGEAVVTFKVPQYNGSLTVMVVAYNDTAVGCAQSKVVVRDPIVVELAVPRFLIEGDEATVNIGLFNTKVVDELSVHKDDIDQEKNKSQEMKGNLRLTTANDSLKLNWLTSSASSKKVTDDKSKEYGQTGVVETAINLKANEQQFLPLHIKANRAGEAGVSYELDLEGDKKITADTVEFQIKSMHGPITHHETQWLQPGQEMELTTKLLDNIETRGAVITVTATPHLVQPVASWIRMLMAYPYQCLEQRISRGVVGLVAQSLCPSPSSPIARKNGKNSKKDPQPAIPKAAYDPQLVLQTLSYIAQYQDSDSGGVYFWGRGSCATQEPDLWLSAYAADFIFRAKEQKYNIPVFCYEGLINFLKNQVYTIQNKDLKEWKQADFTGSLYAMYVLLKVEQANPAMVRYARLHWADQIETALGRCLIGAALVKIGDIQGAAIFFDKLLSVNGQDMVGPYGTTLRDYTMMVTLLKEVLKEVPSLKEAQEAFSQIMKVINQQAGNADEGSTQEAAWLLLAAQALLSHDGDHLNMDIMIGDKLHDGVPMVMEKIYPSTLEKKPLVIVNKGNNSVWIGVIAQGASKGPIEAVTDQGISIQRKYYTLNGDIVDVEKDDLKSGEQLVVVISGTIDTPQDFGPKNQILLVDWLPACFEVDSIGSLNIASKTTGSFASNDQSSDEDWLPWRGLSVLEYTQIRDDRLIGCVNMANGVKAFKVAYITRLTYPGIYNLPHSKAEYMFNPKIFGRTNEGKITVKSNTV